MQDLALAIPRQALDHTTIVRSRPVEKPTRVGYALWQRSWFLAAVALAMAIPFLFATIPPLTDLPRHMAQYKIAADLGSSPYLARFYDYHWLLVGNLGVDIPVRLLAPAIGVERATWLVLATIPPLMAAGMLLVAHEIHGALPPTAFFALPLAYGFPFQFGFVNFSMSIALLFAGVGLWLRLGRLERRSLRAIVFIPGTFVLFVAHSVGWAMFGMTIAAIEFVNARRTGLPFLKAVAEAVQTCLPLAPSVLALGYWLGQASGKTGDWDPLIKFVYLLKLFCNDHRRFDLLSAGIVYSLLLIGTRRAGLQLDSRLGLAALISLAAFIAAPAFVKGSYYADMRMVPTFVTLGLLALDTDRASPRARGLIAAAGLLFTGARLADQAVTYERLDREYRTDLAAVDHLPYGARVFALVGKGCGQLWGSRRIEHLPAIATVRRDAFVNGMWELPGSKLLTIHYAAAGRFAYDPVGTVTPYRCALTGSMYYHQSMADFPRTAFDYVWLLNIPERRWPHEPDLIPIWRNTSAILYRIER